MKVGILGLGLIGGSLAKAYKKSNNLVYAYDNDSSILSFAKVSNVIDHDLNQETIPECALILLCIYPEASLDWLKANACFISKETIVIDCCGVKKNICEQGFKIAEDNGFTFVGGHPMAGAQYSGFKNSSATLFKGAPMVLVPPIYDDVNLYDKIKTLLADLEFSNISVTTANEHDRVISFTSQLPHIISNCFVKSETIKKHKGFSAGSYRDLSRVAWMNTTMWNELFFENKEMLLNELNLFINNINEYKIALENNDKEKLESLLEEGKKQKEEVDG